MLLLRTPGPTLDWRLSTNDVHVLAGLCIREHVAVRTAARKLQLGRGHPLPLDTVLGGAERLILCGLEPLAVAFFAKCLKFNASLTQALPN